jgi:hypothetical protein
LGCRVEITELGMRVTGRFLVFAMRQDVKTKTRIKVQKFVRLRWQEQNTNNVPIRRQLLVGKDERAKGRHWRGGQKRSEEWWTSAENEDVKDYFKVC